MTIKEKKLLIDIMESVLAIDEHLGGKRDFEEYKNNKTIRRAVERELQIIGEATNSLLKINPTISISFARQIVGMRNQVTHSYDNVNNNIIWSVVVNHLPVLKSEVNDLLKSDDQ